MMIKCSVCGQEFDRNSRYVRKRNFCSRRCRNAWEYRARRKTPPVRREDVNRSRRGTPVTVPAQIIVTKLPSGVFPELMPEEGRQYPAKLHPARGHMAAVMTIEIGGKEIILRPNEYKEVKP